VDQIVAALDLEAMMREALAEADAAGKDGEYPIERVPYVGSHIDTYLGGVLRDESRALFERYEPRMLDWLDDRVTRHRQPKAQD
jgi:hypothetical protein